MYNHCITMNKYVSILFSVRKCNDPNRCYLGGENFVIQVILDRHHPAIAEIFQPQRRCHDGMESAIAGSTEQN